MVKVTIYFVLFALASPVMADNFILNSDGSVTDLSTGLVWQGSSAKSASGPTAVDLCSQGKAEDSYRWRLPSRAELSHLALNLQAIAPAVYWSAESALEMGLYCFSDGAYFQSAELNIPAQVRCVRENPLASALEAVKVWLGSWQNGDIEHYLSSYINEFQPHSGIDHSTWARQRRQRLSSAQEITIDLQTEALNSVDDNSVEIIFMQDYRSRHYRDRIRKRLLLKRQRGRWLIAQEEQLSNLPRQSLSAAAIYYQ